MVILLVGENDQHGLNSTAAPPQSVSAYGGEPAALVAKWRGRN
jgi:hypothetical protein